MSGVHDEHGSASATEHEGAAQPGKAATNDQHVEFVICGYWSARESHTDENAPPWLAWQSILRLWQTCRMNTAMALNAVGPRLRALRKARGVTLEQMAERTGISISTLSRLESGRRRPTLELLFALAQEYRVPLDELVGAPQVADPRIHPRPINRNGTTWLALTRNPEGFNAFKQIVPVGHSDTDDRRVHPGYEWLYILSGSLRLALGDEVFDLDAGEVAEFDTTVPHAIANVGTVAVEVLIIYSHDGERLHLHGTSPDPTTDAESGGT